MFACVFRGFCCSEAPELVPYPHLQFLLRTRKFGRRSTVLHWGRSRILQLWFSLFSFSSRQKGLASALSSHPPSCMQGVYCLKSHLCSKLGEKKKKTNSRGPLLKYNFSAWLLKDKQFELYDYRTVRVVVITKLPINEWRRAVSSSLTFWSKSVIFKLCTVWTHCSSCEINGGPHGNRGKTSSYCAEQARLY